MDVLRNKIIDGSLTPGMHISEEWVSREMGVSRGPVREALRELENEALIIFQPYRGATVREITTEELQDFLLPIRLVLEKQACLRLLPTITETDFNYLEEIVEKMRIAATVESGEDLHSLVDLDVSFHEHLINIADQSYAQQLWRTIQPRIRLAFYRLGPGHQDLQEIAQEHQDLVDALRTRDPQIVSTELENHIFTDVIDLIDKVAKKSR
jgi:DNA-binding GntR family transcriptional regulator